MCQAAAPSKPRAQAGFGLALALSFALSACQSSPSSHADAGRREAPSGTTPSPSPSPKAESSAPPQAEASASTTSSPSPLKALFLPGRLGLALPSSLVGKAGQLKLSGEGGGVGKENSTWVVMNDGRIVSNNSGALISDHGGGLISNNGSSLISNHGAGHRMLAQSDLPATTTPQGDNEPRTYVWVSLAIIDFDDQILEAFFQSGPRLNEWKRFIPQQLKYLPPPALSPALLAALDAAEEDVKNISFAGLVTQEDHALVLRVMQLPAAKSPLSEGRMLIELKAGEGEQVVVRSRLTAPLEAFLGVADSSARLELSKNAFGRVLSGDINLRYAPPEQRSAIGMAITGGLDQRASRNRTRLELIAPDRSRALLAASELHFVKGAFHVKQGWNAVAHRPASLKDLGLAILSRKTAGPLAELPPLMWFHPILGLSAGSGSPTPYYSPEDGVYATQASDELKALTPSFTSSDDAFIPAIPQPGEDPTTKESDLPATPSAALFALPESP